MTTVIVIGNEKGGSGKTTTSMHLITALLYLGFKVASIDADVRQGSLSRYIENRKQNKANIPHPQHFHIHESKRATPQDKSEEEQNLFNDILAKALPDNDFIVIDTPGTNNPLAELAHLHANLIITPINDSFVDIDLLAQVNLKLDIVQPGIYSQMVWQQKMRRAQRDRASIDWLIMRNRISSLDNINKRNTERVIHQLSKRMGCRIAPGFGERVIFKQLFPSGLTLLDLKSVNEIGMSIAHLAARQELLQLLHALNLDNVDQALEKSVF